MNKGKSKFVLGIISILMTNAVGEGDAGAKEIVSGKCISLSVGDVPVGDFGTPRHQPESPMSITQGYNTSYADGYKYNSVWYYGHAGLDGEGTSAAKGVNDVRTIFDGVVMLSYSKFKTGGWGDVEIIATRAHKYSEEILTHHYGHMHSKGAGQSYSTTRKFNACDTVKAGEIIGKEGSTGFSTGSHLHLGVRRWKNMEALNVALGKEGKSLYGYGYVFGYKNRLKKNLDPNGLIFNTYLDYQEVNGQKHPYFWSLPYVLQIRELGIEFGGALGEFGAQVPATRALAAKWVKIASERDSIFPPDATFYDVQSSDSKYPYVEALTRYPSVIPVINPDHSCKTGGKYFCPDSNISRPEALKMVISAFYEKEFLKIYNSMIWKNSYAAGLEVLNKLQDVDPQSWYAPYVYFGTYMGLVAMNENFHPEADVMREELAKWVIQGYQNLQSQAGNPCNTQTCPLDYYCDLATFECSPLPICIPSETQDCEVGGGFEPCNAGSECSQGDFKEQSCGNGGTETAYCSGSCQWGAWEQCTGSGACSSGQQQPCGNCGIMTCQANNEWGACMNQGECSLGSTQLQACNGSGTQERSCSTACTWNSWGSCSVQTQCAPGNTQQQNCNGGSGTQSRTCDANGFWGTWGTCVSTCECSGSGCCDGCNYQPSSYVCDTKNVYQCEGSNPGQDAQKALVKTYCTGSGVACNGSKQQGSWQILDNCTSGEVCQMSGGTPQCVYQCQDKYVASKSQSCYNNPQGSGNPTLCLKVQQVSGYNWQYQMCKSGGTFSTSFYYQLKDDNHMVNYTKYTGTAGSSCTPWKSFNVSHVTGSGPVNGAGLMVYVTSPTTCTQSACKYKAGGITLYKSCL